MHRQQIQRERHDHDKNFFAHVGGRNRPKIVHERVGRRGGRPSTFGLLQQQRREDDVRHSTGTSSTVAGQALHLDRRGEHAAKYPGDEEVSFVRHD